MLFCNHHLLLVVRVAGGVIHSFTTTRLVHENYWTGGGTRDGRGFAAQRGYEFRDGSSFVWGVVFQLEHLIVCSSSVGLG